MVKLLLKDFRNFNIKEKAADYFLNEYMIKAQNSVSLRNTLIHDFSCDKDGQYLYFSKDEIQFILGILFHKNRSKKKKV